MESDDKQLKDISYAIDELFVKVDKLKTKLDNLCRKTDGCGRVNKKENINGTNIDTLHQKK